MNKILNYMIKILNILEISSIWCTIKLKNWKKLKLISFLILKNIWILFTFTIHIYYNLLYSNSITITLYYFYWHVVTLVPLDILNSALLSFKQSESGNPQTNLKFKQWSIHVKYEIDVLSINL